MGQKLTVQEIEVILNNEFHPATSVCSATSRASNSLQDGLRTSTVTCTLHRDCFAHLLYKKENLSSLLSEGGGLQDHVHYNISDLNVYDGVDLAIKVILKKNTFDSPSDLYVHCPKIFDVIPSKKEPELNTKYSLEHYLDEAASLHVHVTLPKIKGSSVPTSPVIRRSSSARELSLSAPLLLPPSSFIQRQQQQDRSKTITIETDMEGEASYLIPQGLAKHIVSVFASHANLNCLVQALETNSAFLLVCEKQPFHLCDMLSFSEHSNSDVTKLFICYQMLQALNHCHINGISHGNLEPSKILLSRNKLWVYMCGFECPSVCKARENKSLEGFTEIVQKWVNKEISNFEYLMYLNQLSGRRMNNPNNHPILPWVIDFSSENGGWRDLTRSKYRLTKGDEQLDITYATSENTYHITEPLSDLTYYHYMARKTPVSILRKYVRANYEPNEYPSAMQRLYDWTPDECIPEFFTDPSIFVSQHAEMPDLSVPDWAKNAEDFIIKHRNALESDQVSKNLHHWIDLMFGFKLNGLAGIEAKNVAMLRTDKNKRDQGGFVQLFTSPHPKRNVDPSPGAPVDERAKVYFYDSNLQEFENSRNFHIECEELLPCYQAPPVKEECNDVFQQLRNNDMFSMGCIISELFLETPLFTHRTMQHYIDHNQLPSDVYKLPYSVRAIVLDMLTSHTKSAGDILESQLFPKYFTDMYEFLSSFHLLRNWNAKLSLTIENLSKLLAIPDEGFDLVLPFLLDFFSDQVDLDLRLQAASSLFDSLGAKLGPYRCKKTLLQPIVKLYHVQNYEHVLASLLDLKFVTSMINRLGQSCFIDSILPYFLEALRLHDEKVASLIRALLPRVPSLIGNFLTIKYVIYPLLQQLTKSNPERAVLNLIDIGKQLGEEAIVNSYVPYLFGLLQKNSSKQSKGEETLVAVLELIRGLVDIISSATTFSVFVNQSNILFSLLLNPLSSNTTKAIVKTLVFISFRIGPNHTEKSVIPYIQQFLAHYNDFYAENSLGNIVQKETPNAELRQIYSAKIAYLLYDQYAPLLGAEKLREKIPNSSLIELLAKQHKITKKVSGNAAKSYRPTFATSSEGLKPPVEGESLNWLYSACTEEHPRSWNFSGNVVTAIKAHNGTIRCMDVLPNETCFVTGGKDNTVKFWCLEDSSLNISYNEHTSTINDVHFMNDGNLVASCSSNSIYVWDVDKRYRLLEMENENNWLCFEPIRNDRTLVAVNSESVISFIDLNSGKSTHEWVLPAVSSSFVKCLLASDDSAYIVTGTSAGDIVLLDQRSGFILDSWRAHEGPVTKIARYGKNHIISSSADKTVCVWDIRSGTASVAKRIHVNDSVDAFTLHKQTLITASGNKVGQMDLGYELQQLDQEFVNMNATMKLSNSKFGAHVKTMGTMFYHQFILFGGDDGVLRITH